MNYLLSFATGFLFIAVTLSPAAAGKFKDGFTPTEVIEYKQPEGKPLCLHVFKPEGWKASDQRPAAVFFFGGGWVGGTPAQFFPHADHLAKRGMVAISAEYRTKSSHKTSPKECVEDGKSVVRWIRAHAKELGIDPDKLAVGGGSAGGHVAAASSFCKGFDAEADGASISATANALLLFNPVLDNGPGEYGHNKVKDYWESISAAHNVKAPVPPIFYVLGTEDDLIPVATAQRFKETVTKAEGRCDLHIYKDAGHGFFNRDPFFDQTIQAMDDFIVSLGWLKKVKP